MAVNTSERKPWLLPLAGAVAAMTVVAGEGLVYNLGSSAIAILSLRAGGIGLLLGSLQEITQRLISHSYRRAFEIWGSAALAAAWAIWIADHLSRTTTLRAALPFSLAFGLPTIALLPILWLSLVAHIRLLAKGVGTPAALTAVLLGFLLLAPASSLADLHAPLASSCTIAAGLSIELGLASLIRRAPGDLLRYGVLLATGLASISPLLSVPPIDAFLAADRSTPLRQLARMERAQEVFSPVEPGVSQAPALRPVSGDLAEREKPTLPIAAGRSIVLITIDALRADRLAVLGYERQVTPSLDAFSREAVIFKRAYAPSPTSSFSIPALHAGRPMEALLRAGAPLPETLADRLRAAGYATLGLYPQKVFSAGPELLGRVKRSGFGFARTVLLTMEARTDGAEARRALRKTTSRPVFLWVHFYDPHLPYDCHGNRFGALPEDCYDAEVAHVDGEIGRLLPWLRQQLDEPVIVITADHGEAFGEHGRLYHSTDLHEEQIRVPLLIRVPGTGPRTVDEPVSITDLPKTILALLSIEGNSSFAGNDLRPMMAGGNAVAPVTASINDRHAIVLDSMKLMCIGWPDGPCALHDLETDPGEIRNLIAARSDQATALREQLRRTDRLQMERLSSSLPRPIALGRLGRTDVAAELHKMAGDQNSSHRVEATRTLAMLRRYEVAGLLSTLVDSPDTEVAAWARIGTALLNEPGPAEKLVSYAGAPTNLGRWCAIALGRLGDSRGLEPLLANLDNDEPVIRAESALALGELGDRSATLHLIRLLDIKQSRWAAIEALGRLGDPRAVRHLKRLSETDPDETNSPRYERALRFIAESRH